MDWYRKRVYIEDDRGQIMFKIFMNLVVAPLMLSIIPSLIFTWIGLLGLELWEWVVIFIVIQFVKNSSLSF